MINFKVKRIMLPYDFSANADKALNHAAFITSLLKADLYIYLIRVYDERKLFQEK